MVARTGKTGLHTRTSTRDQYHHLNTDRGAFLCNALFGGILPPTRVPVCAYSVVSSSAGVKFATASIGLCVGTIPTSRIKCSLSSVINVQLACNATAA